MNVWIATNVDYIKLWGHVVLTLYFTVTGPVNQMKQQQRWSKLKNQNDDIRVNLMSETMTKIPMDKGNPCRQKFSIVTKIFFDEAIECTKTFDYNLLTGFLPSSHYLAGNAGLWDNKNYNSDIYFQLLMADIYNGRYWQNDTSLLDSNTSTQICVQRFGGYVRTKLIMCAFILMNKYNIITIWLHYHPYLHYSTHLWLVESIL